MAISGGSTTLTDLIDLVNDRLGNYEKAAAADAVGDGASTVFELPHCHLVAGTVTVLVDDVAQTYSIDLDTGVITFQTAPIEDAAIHAAYHYIQWTDDEVTNAINEALLEAWAEIHESKTDITTITPDGTTSEFTLPADCAYLYKVEYRATSTEPYTKVRQWVVRETDDYAQAVILYQPESTGTYRLCYIPALVELSLGTDTIEANGVPTHAKWAIVWAACATLLGYILGARTRGNQFFNVEGSNVPKIYEMQRIITDYRALAELAFRKARRSPRINTA